MRIDSIDTFSTVFLFGKTRLFFATFFGKTCLFSSSFFGKARCFSFFSISEYRITTSRKYLLSISNGFWFVKTMQHT
jgi:hypothetical protein